MSDQNEPALVSKGLYQHYKGPLYQVLEIAKHSETEEELVIYRALYGAKGLWARPLVMFSESIESDGQFVPRFKRLESQTGVLELAVLDVIAGKEPDFEEAFAEAEKIIQAADGYISHRLKQAVETSSKYLLLVEWQSIEHHQQGFRQSTAYQQWKRLLHHFYEPFPEVHYFR